ncbi:MAG: hypothetical protein R2864_09375 [Syntrophotaleaceae bacterium]
MTADEIRKYINQVAFSSAEEFVEKFKGMEDKNQIIGHFGLGFYSSFMVAGKVNPLPCPTGRTLSPLTGPARAAQLRTGGNRQKGPRHRDRPASQKKGERFLDPVKVRRSGQALLQLPAGDHQAGRRPGQRQRPLWNSPPARPPRSSTRNFTPSSTPWPTSPLFWIHLNVDFPSTKREFSTFPA